MPPKTLFYCMTMDYPPMRGGVARYLSNLADASDGQMKVLVPLKHGENSDDVLKVKFWWNGWPKWLPLIKRCLEVKDGVIFVSHVLPVGTAAWISKIFGGPDYVVLFHGTDLKRIRTSWRKWLLKKVGRKAKRLIVNSQATKVALQKLMPAADVMVLTPGVKPFEGLISRHDARTRLGIAQDTKLVLAVCRLVERKGIDTLLQALSRVVVEEPKVELAVVGQGEYAEPLHQLAALLKIKVRWIEGASDDELANWYSAADIFCLPSREQADDVEGFGMVFLEAAMAGLPVIAGQGWGTEEAVLNNVTGFVVPAWKDPVAEALVKLLRDENLRLKMGQAGRERALKDFQWKDRWSKLQGSEQVSDIAVVIPCWNHAKELERTLEALSAQTLAPKEVVVVDNNSTDNPGAVVERFKSKLPIHIVSYKEKQGAPAARNEGARLTSAPYLLFLDSDVELVSDALRIMRQTLEQHPEASFAYSDFYWSYKLFRGQAWNGEDLKHKNWIHTSSLIRRSDWQPFDESLKRFQDWDLWISMSKRGRVGTWIQKPLFRVTESDRAGKISRWVPAFIHRVPWPVFGWMPSEIRRYRDAEAILKKKHGLV
ncbi:MAG: glycosyltransferase [Patescibacteria group bacterium]|nr:glycosyltransferase [Patescibacteria group bacterium]